MPDRMTDGQRFAVLVVLTLIGGTGLCAAIGFIANAIPRNGAAPFLFVVLAVAGIAASCAGFLKLVHWLYRRTY